MKDFHQKISDILCGIVKEKYAVDIDFPLWEPPARREFGDLSTMVSMKLASLLRKNPLEIAVVIKAELEEKLAGDFESIEIIKPAFINIFLSKKELIQSLGEILQKKDKFFRHDSRRKVMVEFVSANPTGPLSIAHGRQAVVGDVIANILDFFGYDVLREYYVNDAGRQLDLLVSSVQAWLNPTNGSLVESPTGIPDDGYKGEYVREIALELSNKILEDKDFRNHSKNADKKFILEYVLNWIKTDLAAVGINFDTWRSQQDILDEGLVKKTLGQLEENGLLYEDQGALWFKSTEFGDDKDRVIRKADGELTYFASDIAYHFEKARRGYQDLINLWGPDHHGYIPRVKASMKALGIKGDILRVIIMQLVTIKSKGRMSKRKGNMILFSELEKEVGRDATRFYYLTRKNSSHLEFNIDLAKEASFNNPLYYIQYANARINSIFEKAGTVEIKPELNNVLTDEADLNLLRALLQFFYCLDKAHYTLEPVLIIEYLKSLAAVFHRYYEQQKVIVESEELTGARLNLLAATKIVFVCALGLLGITPAERM